MIGKLTGRLDSIAGVYALIDVNGVGYVTACSSRTLRELGAEGSPVSLWIETQVREDAINLFGFSHILEQGWFRLLTTVQGVGAKVALSLLGHLSPDELASAIAAQDKAALTQADGVGPKLALRLVTELKDKSPAISGPVGLPIPGASVPEKSISSRLESDALSALINLGYRRAEAFAAVATAQRHQPTAKLDDLLRLSLAELSRKDSAA